MGEYFSGSCCVTSRNTLIHNAETNATCSPRFDAERATPCRFWSAHGRVWWAACYSELPRILLPRRWVNKGPLLPSGEKSHGPHRTITPYVCMLNMGCGLGAGNDSSFL